MVRPRLLFVLMLVLAASAVLPAVALAGGSAGDNQYTDPLAGTHHSGGSQTGSSSSSGSTATGGTTTGATTTPPVSTPAATTPAATVATTTATPTTASTTSAAAKTLPFTGYSDWEAGALGALLVIGGLGLRRRVRA